MSLFFKLDGGGDHVARFWSYKVAQLLPKFAQIVATAV